MSRTLADGYSSLLVLGIIGCEGRSIWCLRLSTDRDWSEERRSMTKRRLTRRTFLATTAAGAVAGFPLPLRAQPKTFKIGVVHPVTGPLAEPGQACRIGAQMAADAINAAGGIKSLGGTKIELLLGDTQTKPENGRVEAERAVGQGAQMLLGSFDSGSTNS